MTESAILAVNEGSSSVKASLFFGTVRHDFLYAKIGQGNFRVMKQPIQAIS